MVAEITLQECPPIIQNYYDQGPIACRVRKVKRHSEGHIVAVLHNYGTDFWRLRSGAWDICNTTGQMPHDHAERLARALPIVEGYLAPTTEKETLPMTDKSTKRSATAETLSALIHRLQDDCKLDDWTALAEEVYGLPMDVACALSSGRPEMLSLARGKDRLPTKEDWDAVIDLVRVLLLTNRLLQAHAEQVAQLIETWTGYFKGLAKTSREIEDYAKFRQSCDD